MNRYRIEVAATPPYGETRITVDCTDDHTALAFIAALTQKLADGDYEMTVEERRTVS